MSKYRVVLEVQSIWGATSVDTARKDFEEFEFIGDYYETIQVVSVEELDE